MRGLGGVGKGECNAGHAGARRRYSRAREMGVAHVVGHTRRRSEVQIRRRPMTGYKPARVK